MGPRRIGADAESRRLTMPLLETRGLSKYFGGLAAVNSSSPAPGLGSGAIGAMFGVGAIIILPLCYGGLGIIMGALTAALYNLFAGLFGGIEMDIQ